MVHYNYFELIFIIPQRINEKSPPVTVLKHSQEHLFPRGDLLVAHFLTTKELSEYLKLHQITIRKYAEEGIIPATRIGRTWIFDKDLIDSWIYGNQRGTKAERKIKRKG